MWRKIEPEIGYVEKKYQLCSADWDKITTFANFFKGYPNNFVNVIMTLRRSVREIARKGFEKSTMGIIFLTLLIC